MTLRYLLRSVVAVGALATVGSVSSTSLGQCESPNPNDWPAPAKPYFMIVVDTSSSMSHAVAGPRDTCGFGHERGDHARCAIRNTVQAFSEVNFGLASYPGVLQDCGPGECPHPVRGGALTSNGASTTCQVVHPEGECGAGSGVTRRGANIMVPLRSDNFWDLAPSPSNIPDLLGYMDNQCGDNREIFAFGPTPLNGSLRDMFRYFQDGWSGFGKTFASPITANDPACRSLNVILVTDGEENNCDEDHPWTDRAEGAALQLYNGFNKDGIQRSVQTFVIDFGGEGGDVADQIADYGLDGVDNGIGEAVLASDEVTLSRALSDIIASQIRPEHCDNEDNNCNGCIDEGYLVYCNERTDCCTADRDTCLSSFALSGDQSDLPCVSSSELTDPQKWLCSDPSEVCDNRDNNCNGQVDEGFGNPVCCPSPESCNGVDDDCDGVIDEGVSGLPYSLPGCVDCQPSAEICDGCDNDCDGLVDEGQPLLECGFSPPSHCLGERVCPELAAVTVPGACHPGGNAYTPCTNDPQTEICDDLDNDCDGQLNEVPPEECDHPDFPGLIYQGDNHPAADKSVCVRGTKPCDGECTGYVGPSPERCDGLDNDCDGQVDEDDPLPGEGNVCGSTQGRCSEGLTRCLDGELVCSGGTASQPEVCDGFDNDCDGRVDEPPLADAPSSPSCWGLPGVGCGSDPACQHAGLQWCPPAGGTCKGVGILSTPCNTGTLQCNGGSGWICMGGTLPGTEVCDGADNDCDGARDEALGPPVGDQCGFDVGECEFGSMICDAGVLECDGGVSGVAELCDGLDNDCDGEIDNGLPIGGSCAMVYDADSYPGDRTHGECRPGTLECDPAGSGELVCTGGVGPQAEVCDGLDNDCDGLIDEPGAAPDGIDGSADPDDSTRILGDSCGLSEGECEPGVYICQDGNFVCAGGLGPQPEDCDCLDNDCDGRVDEDADPDQDPICSPGKLCVESAPDQCQCAPPCRPGEFPCATGTECVGNLNKSGTDEPAGPVCVEPHPCEQCSTTVLTQDNGGALCGPDGTLLANGKAAPECLCKDTQCVDPCAGIECETGFSCYAENGQSPICQPDGDCRFFGCADGQACTNGACLDDPCDPNPCWPDEVCKPNAAFDAARCVPSCADVTCDAPLVCVEGNCQETGCEETCAPDQVCKPDGHCGQSECSSDTCNDGSWCNAATGSCADDPCTAVRCPAGQHCVMGDCWHEPSGESNPSEDNSTSSPSDETESTVGEEGKLQGRWGLTSGGGGCSTQAGSRDGGIAFALAFAALAVSRRRMRQQNPSQRAQS